MVSVNEVDGIILEFPAKIKHDHSVLCLFNYYLWVKSIDLLFKHSFPNKNKNKINFKLFKSIVQKIKRLNCSIGQVLRTKRIQIAPIDIKFIEGYWRLLCEWELARGVRWVWEKNKMGCDPNDGILILNNRLFAECEFVWLKVAIGLEFEFDPLGENH